MSDIDWAKFAKVVEAHTVVKFGDHTGLILEAKPYTNWEWVPDDEGEAMRLSFTEDNVFRTCDRVDVQVIEWHPLAPVFHADPRLLLYSVGDGWVSFDEIMRGVAP